MSSATTEMPAAAAMRSTCWRDTSSDMLNIATVRIIMTKISIIVMVVSAST